MTSKRGTVSLQSANGSATQDAGARNVSVLNYCKTRNMDLGASSALGTISEDAASRKS